MLKKSIHIQMALGDVVNEYQQTFITTFLPYVSTKSLWDYKFAYRPKIRETNYFRISCQAAGLTNTNVVSNVNNLLGATFNNKDQWRGGGLTPPTASTQLGSVTTLALINLTNNGSTLSCSAINSEEHITTLTTLDTYFTVGIYNDFSQGPTDILVRSVRMRFVAVFRIEEIEA